MLTYINNHCVLCNRWLGRPQDMRIHLVGDHGLPWASITTRGIQLTAQHGSHQPCQLCNKRVRAVRLGKDTHQAALLQLYAKPGLDL